MKSVTKINKPSNNASVGEKIKYLRCNQLMNQEELANKVGRKREEITMFEKGSRTIDIYTLKDIAQVFNVSTDYLLGLTNFESAETENRSINELTGLSDEAIINLININKYHNGNILTIINYLLEQEKMFPNEYYKQIEQTERTKEDDERLSRECREWKEKKYKRLFALIDSYFNIIIEKEESLYITNNSIINKNEIIDTSNCESVKEIISSKDVAETYLLDKIKLVLKEAKQQYLEEQTRNED